MRRARIKYRPTHGLPRMLDSRMLAALFMGMPENIVSELRGIVGNANVLTAQEDLIP